MTLSPRLRHLLQPLNLAALLTWAAVLLTLQEEAQAVGVVRQQLQFGLMLAFLLSFYWPDLCSTTVEPARPRAGSLVFQALLALGICSLSRSTAAPVLIVIVVAQLAMLLPLRLTVFFVLVLNAALFLVYTLVWKAQKPLLLLAIYGGFQAFAGVTAWYARQAQENAAALRSVNAHLLATRSLLEESARDQERLRLARELHDVAGHKLTAVKLNLALLQRGAAEDPAQTLATVARLADELLGDLRGVVAQMRQHDGMDLRQAIEQLVAPLPSPRIELDLAEDARVANVAQAEALIRAVQEALTNIVRHADAQLARVSLRRDGDQIVLQVSDDGRGCAALCEGHGLSGMRERVAALDGTVNLSQPTAGGMLVEVRLGV